MWVILQDALLFLLVGSTRHVRLVSVQGWISAGGVGALSLCDELGGRPMVHQDCSILLGFVADNLLDDSVCVSGLHQSPAALSSYVPAIGPTEGQALLDLLVCSERCGKHVQRQILVQIRVLLFGRVRVLFGYRVGNVPGNRRLCGLRWPSSDASLHGGTGRTRGRAQIVIVHINDGGPVLLLRIRVIFSRGGSLVVRSQAGGARIYLRRHLAVPREVVGKVPAIDARNSESRLQLGPACLWQSRNSQSRLVVDHG
jgi:hypothetical protein